MPDFLQNSRFYGALAEDIVNIAVKMAAVLGHPSVDADGGIVYYGGKARIACGNI